MSDDDDAPGMSDDEDGAGVSTWVTAYNIGKGQNDRKPDLKKRFVKNGVAVGAFKNVAVAMALIEDMTRIGQPATAPVEILFNSKEAAESLIGRAELFSYLCYEKDGPKHKLRQQLKAGQRKMLALGTDEFPLMYGGEFTVTFGRPPPTAKKAAKVLSKRGARPAGAAAVKRVAKDDFEADFS